MSSVPTTSNLHDRYASESAHIRQRFEATAKGNAVLAERTALVDSIVRELFHEIIAGPNDPPKQFCLAALGGYGRKVLFPHSDVDLLFLVEDKLLEPQYKNKIALMNRELWDIGVRVSPTNRTLAECGQLHRDNLEFNISLLDCRYLAGDGALFAKLREETIPQMVLRESTPLVQNLAELTRSRHEKFGHTISHLEPNIKEGPGGIRDYNVICWLELIGALERRHKFPGVSELSAVASSDEISSAFAFLSSVRCFLHYRQGRDNNNLSYEFQDEAAASGIGLGANASVSPADWMRHYFRHSRAIYQLAVQVMDEVPPARSSLYTVFRDWRSRLSNAYFSVVRERVFLKQTNAIKEPEILLSLFEFLARHGFRLSGEAERHVREAVPVAESCASHISDYWLQISRILTLPYAADALRAMHRLGILVALFPELRLIDSLVIRDFYHRYTVDEHSFTTIETLHRLKKPANALEQRYLDILNGVEDKTALMYLALLFHDVGKGMENESHVEGSLQVLDGVLERLKLGAAQCETVRFLVGSHLLMSATLLRRDIFDPETVRNFSESVGTIENLELLTLFTYADIKSVNPDALTPWKAETLWQLYAETVNYLNRSIDGFRLHMQQQHAARIEQIRALVEDGRKQELDLFLEGFPTRYLLTHTSEQIVEHFRIARRRDNESVHVLLEKKNHHYELTLITQDRTGLMATIAGAIAAWGMNILKADVFSNDAGLVLDTFSFTDLFSTLDLNPTEIDRFEKHMVEVVSGERDVDAMLGSRMEKRPPSPKVKIETQIWFDNESSSASTILELVSQDRPGLLYLVASLLNEAGCNIEVALIDTEGQKAIDVFYITHKGKKLGSKTESNLREALVGRLDD